MAEGKQKSLDEAMLETLGKATEEAPAEEQAVSEDAQEGQAENPSVDAQATGDTGEDARAAAATEDTAEDAAPVAKDSKSAPGKDAKKSHAAEAKPVPKSGMPPGWPRELYAEYATLPRGVKNHFLKREGEIARERATHQRTAKEYSEASKRLNGFQAALEPYLPNLKALGVAPEAAIQELFQAHHVLRTGSRAERADLVAGLAQNFDVAPELFVAGLVKRGVSVDVGALAAVLKGETPVESARPTPPPQRKPEEFRDPRVDALIANGQRARQQREQRIKAQNEATHHQHIQELQEFAASGEAPHFDKVLKQMAAVSSAAAATGEELTVKETYERACYLNPEVRTLMAKEAEALKSQEAQRAQQARTKQAIGAASSVKTEPGAPSGARKKTVDEAIFDIAARFSG